MGSHSILGPCRYLVRARVKVGRERALAKAINAGTLGRGSVAGGEYLRDMNFELALALGRNAVPIWQDLVPIELNTPSI
jgi:hypothetical protein